MTILYTFIAVEVELEEEYVNNEPPAHTVSISILSLTFTSAHELQFITKNTTFMGTTRVDASTAWSSVMFVYFTSSIIEHLPVSATLRTHGAEVSRPTIKVQPPSRRGCKPQPGGKTSAN
jgi:hypothetical protein